MGNTNRPNRYPEKIVISVTLIKKSTPNIGLDLKIYVFIVQKVICNIYSMLKHYSMLYL